MKLTIQMPSSTSLIPRRWPARTVETLKRFRCMQNSAACGDEDVAIVQGICEFGQAVITARRGRVELGGALHVDGLVWSFLVEFFYELVEAGLLLQAVHAGRPGGLFLEREMHALVTPVLLGISRLDPLDGDAEFQPPDREFGEVEQGIRAGEGHAVVGSDSLREAALLEKLLERGDREVSRVNSSASHSRR